MPLGCGRFPWAWDRSFSGSGLCQARLNVCEAELVAGFVTEVVVEHPGVCRCSPRLSCCP